MIRIIQGDTDRIDWFCKDYLAPHPIGFDSAAYSSRTFRINGLLKDGDKMVFNGPIKSGKSFLMLELATAIATGTEWQGRKCTKGKVLIIDYQHRMPEIYDRLKTINNSLDSSFKSNITIWPLMGVNLDGESDEFAKTINAIVRLKSIDVVIFDPIYKFFPNVENGCNSKANSDFFRFENILSRERHSIIYVHYNLNKDDLCLYEQGASTIGYLTSNYNRKDTASISWEGGY